MQTEKKDSLDEPVYKDSRGEIHRKKEFGVKFNVLYTKAGALRSGDVHSSEQYDLFLKGETEIWFQKGDKIEKIVKGPNEFLVIPPNIPHLFKALTDTVMIEWWEKDFDVKYFEPFRKLVEEQFKNKE
ncbi:MAG: hypothetical protein KKF46_02120 [Nanoarchaeota archaeon]|nr:hypothetical protein [Nanoarchaeota archaeon]MBU1321130.1 hypothetical protein [Nanoarchaeota archaeon]MBU1597961.1 hypothetical protein [Nanoarchaeota archaeon]MBU2441806.1 hypothetical protein [Nanoarchaeota archaeon]